MLKTLSTAVFILLILIGGCVEARSEPLDVDYINLDTSRTMTRLRLCTAAGCSSQPISCAPTATCAAVFNEPIGYREYWLIGIGEDGSVSPESQRRMRWVISDAERFDVNRDGDVTTLDFARFFAEFMR